MKQTHQQIMTRVLAVAISLFLAAGLVQAQKSRTRRIRFERGRTTTVIKDAVVLGTRDRYLLRASAGQTLIVHITSLEDNADFNIYRPGSRRPMAGASEATDWTGELPRNGDYVIEVGPTRGNATYTLEVTIR